MRKKINNKMMKAELLQISKELEAEVEAFEIDIRDLKEENKQLKLIEQKLKSSIKSKEEKLKAANEKVSRFSKTAEDLEIERQRLSKELKFRDKENEEKDNQINGLLIELVQKDLELKKNKPAKKRNFIPKWLNLKSKAQKE